MNADNPKHHAKATLNVAFGNIESVPNQSQTQPKTTIKIKNKT